MIFWYNRYMFKKLFRKIFVGPPKGELTYWHYFGWRGKDIKQGRWYVHMGSLAEGIITDIYLIIYYFINRKPDKFHQLRIRRVKAHSRYFISVILVGLIMLLIGFFVLWILFDFILKI